MDRNREFKGKVCSAAVKIAVAELWSGPPARIDSEEAYLAQMETSERKQSEALDAIIEVILFAKTHGDSIMECRLTHNSREGE